jgi:glycosyltransferase involved in cell wall biosynthesis
MTTDRKPRFFFAAYLAGGNATLLANLKSAIGGRPDLDSAWVGIPMDPESARYGKHGEVRRRPLVPGTFRNSLLTGRAIRELERTGAPFDAAWFFAQTICLFLERFRHRVPSLIGMDGTPLYYARHQLWYAQLRFDPRTVASRARNLLTRRVYRQAFHLVPLSTGVRQSLIEEYGIPPERITVVPPGVDLTRFMPPDRSGPEREAVPFNVLFVGADFERKGGDLVTGLALQPEFRDVQFHIVSRSYRGPSAANIHVHGGVTHQSSDVLGLYSRADVFVLPTRADSHSVASVEAMAMGLPVVTTPVGGIIDIVEEGVTGFFVPPDDPAALAERIRQLRADRALRLRMGRAGRQRAEARFSLETIAATLVELMKRAAASRR